MKHLSDHDLVSGYVKTKDQEFLAELFARYSDLIYRVSLRIVKNTSDAEDMMQMIYCKLIKNLDSFGGHGSFVGWLVRMVTHTCYNYRRSEKSRVNRERIVMAKREPFYEFTHADDEVKKTIESQLSKLPDRYRAPVILRLIEGLSMKEISEALAIPEKTIRSQLSRGLEKLKVSLENIGVNLSVVGISTLIEAMPKPTAPEIFKSKEFIQESVQKALSSHSQKHSYVHKAKLSVVQKSILIMSIVLSVSATVIWYQSKENREMQVLSANLTTEGVTKQETSQKMKKLVCKFDSPKEYENLKIASGEMHITSKGIDRSLCLELMSGSLLAIDLSQFELPVKISYFNDIEKLTGANKGLACFLYPAKEASTVFRFVNIGQAVFAGQFKVKGQYVTPGYEGIWAPHSIYITKENTLTFLQEELTDVMFVQSGDVTKLYLQTLDKILIDNIVIESIRPEEVPDYRRFKKFLEEQKLPERGTHYELNIVPYAQVLQIKRTNEAPPYSSFQAVSSKSFNAGIETILSEKVREILFEK